MSNKEKSLDTASSRNYDAQKIAELRREGKTWDAIRDEVGLAGIPARELIARNGFDSKGQPFEIAPIKATGKALVDRLVKERQAGTAWYALEIATGKTRKELNEILKDADGLDKPRFYKKQASKPKTTETEAAKPAASKPKRVRRSKVAKGSDADPS